jgi:hypothetical protein
MAHVILLPLFASVAGGQQVHLLLQQVEVLADNE